MSIFYGVGRDQQGSTLFIALTFLVVITLMGLSGMQTATLQERMAGSERDYSIALQSAEMALRDAERDILAVDFNNAPVPGRSDSLGGVCGGSSIGRPCFSINKVGFPLRTILGSANLGRVGWSSFCMFGQCYVSTNPDPTIPVPNVIPIWNDQNLWATDALSAASTIGSSVTYGTFTGAPALAVPTQPRYIIELIDGSGGGLSAPESSTGSVQNFRITARAVGLNPRTVVLLQEVFQCSDC